MATEYPLPKSQWGRWWQYFRERFPLQQHGPLVLAFSACAVSFSAALRGASAPSLTAMLVAFPLCLTAFLHLRIADEFKDAEEDRRWRPYRAVPRGLITLRQLAGLGVLTAIAQWALAWWWSPTVFIVLAIMWVWLIAMSFEFGVGRWLRRQPLCYMFSHMLIMPLIDVTATATDWGPFGAPPAGLFLFLASSFAGGLVIEMGRKIRTPADEEAGVDTYSRLWGLPRASAAWLLTMLSCAALAVAAAAQIGAHWYLMPPLALMLIWALLQRQRLLRQPVAGAGRAVERLSGGWILVLYLSLGITPWL